MTNMGKSFSLNTSMTIPIMINGGSDSRGKIDACNKLAIHGHKPGRVPDELQNKFDNIGSIHIETRSVRCLRA